MKPMIAALIACSLLQAQSPQLPFALLDNTSVRLRLTKNLSSATAREGETIDFEVVDEIVINGVLVANRGSIAVASVTKAKERGHMGKGGKLDINIDYLRLVDGEKVPLKSVTQSRGGGNSGKMTGAMVATSLVFWPAAPLFLFIKGKDVTIPKGTELTAYVSGDIRLDPQRFQAGTMSPGAPAVVSAQVTNSAPAAAAAKKGGTPLTNADIAVMKTAGLGDELIVAKIKSSGCGYQLDPAYLIQLKSQGISEPVIRTMIEVCQ